MRIFTLDREMPFAGHPTLGSCHAWLSSGGSRGVKRRSYKNVAQGLFAFVEKSRPYHLLHLLLLDLGRYYVPYFAEMQKKKLVEPFWYIISATNKKADTDKWLVDNQKRVDEFMNWSNAYQMPTAR